MSDAILVLNAGSSSLKFSDFPIGGGEPLFRGKVDALETDGGRTQDQSLESALEQCEAQVGSNRIVAAGHRVVHDGVRYAEPVTITPGVLADLGLNGATE